MRFRKEEIYMNKQIITVDLVTENEKELLVFNFDEKISLDLTSDNADILKSFFQSLLQKIENQDICLELKKTDRTDLFYDVAKKYIEHLNIEITSIISQKLNIIDDSIYEEIIENNSNVVDEEEELEYN